MNDNNQIITLEDVPSTNDPSFWIKCIFMQLISHGINQRISGSDSITYSDHISQLNESFYMDLFIKYFIHHPHDSTDDLLFFVKKLDGSTEAQASRVVIKRKSFDRKLPQLEDVMDWKASLYLNCITQMHYVLIVSICSRAIYPKSSPAIKQQIQRLVYAVPNASLHISKKEYPFTDAYPLIYFTVDDFDQIFSQMNVEPGDYICVELNALLTDDPIAYNQEQPSRLPGYCPSIELSLFQGAVSYESLSRTYNRRLSLLKNDKNHEQDHSFECEFILMRGPNGKGQAQAAIKPPNNQTSWIKKNLLSKNSLENTQTCPLQCQLTFVNLHWENIIQDLVDHFAL